MEKAIKKPYKGKTQRGYVEVYGWNWPTDIYPTKLLVEMACFREKMAKRMKFLDGGVSPAHHFKQIALALWPESGENGRTAFIWNPWADIMLEESVRENFVAVAGSGGFGKSEFYAIWGIVNFLVDPTHTLVFVTSTTIGASKKRIWGKIVKYWNAISGIPMFSYGKLVDSAGMVRYVDKNGVAILGDLVGITLVPAEKSKEKDAMGKIQGMHQERIVFIADEHSEISESVTEAAIYNLKLSAAFFQFIGMANPASYTDAFGSFAKPKDGWDSINVEMDKWETARGVCIHFDHMRNPNVIAGRKVYKWMPDQEDIDAEMKVHGGNTSAFWRMYRGFWVPAGVDDAVFTEVEIINSKAMDKAVWQDNKLIKLSFMDPSFTNGGDRTVACFGTFGENLEGLKVLQFDEWLTFQEDVTDKTLTRSQQVAQWWRNACIKRGVQPRYAGLDATGGGGPLSDMITVVWSKDIYKLNFGGKASELPVSAYDPTPSCERYVNACTEIWFSTKEYMLTGQIKGIDKDCMREMVLRKIDKHGEKNIGLRLKVLPKAEMKSKHGFSPDYAEAALGLCALARERLGFHTRDGVKAMSTQPEAVASWKPLFQKYQNVYNV